MVICDSEQLTFFNCSKTKGLLAETGCATRLALYNHIVFVPLVFCNVYPGLVMLLSMLRGKDINLIEKDGIDAN